MIGHGKFSRRRGFMLVLVPVLLLVVLAGLLVVNYLTRTQYGRSHALRVGQEAAYLAEGALNLARCWLDGREGRAFLGRLTRLAVEQLDASSAKADLTEDVELPGLGLLTAGFPDATVTVQVRLKTNGPLRVPRSVDGLMPDPLEAEATLEIVSRCQWQGLVRQVRGRYGARLMSVLPPLVSRFVLLARESGALAAAVNCLDYDPAAKIFRDAASGARTDPIEVHSAPEGMPGTVADVGWTFLGGPDPWFLQLTAGKEQALLRRSAHMLPVSVLGPDFQEKIHSGGFARGTSSMAMLGFAGNKWTSPATGQPITERVSLLHLAGAVDSSAVPVVLGPVYRRFISFSKLRRGASGPFQSFVYVRDEAQYRKVAEPFETLTGKGYEEYRKVMARVVEEPYNRAYDYLMTAKESPAVPPPMLRPGALAPFAAGEPLFYPEPSKGPAGPTRARISRIFGAGAARPIFAGDPAALEGYEELMLARVTRLVPAKKLSGPELDLRGHVARLKQSPARLPALRVVTGGTLVCDGDVTLEGPIECAAPELLTIMSLRGSITLLSPGPIQAALVAPRGQIVPPAAGGLELRGLLACRNLDNFPLWMQNPGRKKIEYNPLLNSTSAENSLGSYRLVLLGTEDRFLERH